MKKRLLALLLALATVLSLIVIPTYAAEVDTGAVTVTDPAATTCGCGCGKKFSEVEWKAWTGEVSSGHFYLTGDYTQEDVITVISGEGLVLDLRGHTITTEGYNRLFYVNGYVGVLDTVGGGRVSARSSYATGYNGGIICVADNETAGSIFELYSGTVTPAADARTPKNGGLVYLGDGATFRMYDGLLLNGKAASDRNGGAIAASTETATVDIQGGSIVGCSAGVSGGAIYAYDATVTVKNCSVIGGTAGARGGNIFQKGGSLTIENCVIAGGSAGSTDKYGGGNVSTVSGGTYKITDSIIYGGYALTNGGNLSLGYGTSTLKNCQVYGGTCEGAGSNIAMPVSTATVTMDGCTVDGGMGYICGKLTLKGATKIALTNGGLDLTEQTKATTATGLSGDAEVYVSGNKTLTGSLTYIKPALGATVSASGTTITVTPAADGETAGYCPHCGKQVAWQSYGTEGASHTYLTADMANFAELSVTGDLVIDLRGFDITAAGRAFNVASGATLAVIDSVGGGVVTGAGVAGETGGIFTNAGTLQLWGGKYIYASGNAVTGGGIVSNAGTLEIRNAIFDASAFKNTDETAMGGAILSADGSYTVTAKGLYVIGGSACFGGSAYFGCNNTVSVTASVFQNGTAVEGGGNIAFRGTSDDPNGTMTLTQVSILDGKTTGDSSYAGNLYMGRYASCAVTDSYLSGGEAKYYGGNFSVNLGATVTFTNCMIEDGTAGDKGGQVYLPGNSCVLTLDRCLMTNGTAPVGGNIYVNNGYCTVKGGEISYGTATSDYGGNIYTSTDDGTGTTLTADANGNAPLLSNGTAADKGGNIFAGKIANIEAVRFADGTAPNGGNDLYVYGSAATLALGSGVEGNVYLNAYSGLLTDEVYGGAISGVTCRSTDANYYLDGEYGNCGLTLQDTTLYVAVAAVVDKTGSAAWYASNADAVSACDAGSYVKLFTDNELVLTKDLYADLNGNTVTVSGSYAFCGMDSSGDSFTEPTGKAILSGTQAAAAEAAPNGSTYVPITGTDGITYHRLDMKITGVSIRPSADGMYYTAKWSCDDTLKAMIDTYGVVASTNDMPDADFASGDDNLWTSFTQDSFVSGQAKNGAVISGIMKTEDRTAGQNDEYGKKPVYAKAYITLTDGTCLVSNGNIHLSLYDVMENLDRLIVERPIKYRKFNLAARNFYEKWKDNGMGDWSLSKIPAPEDDGVIDVLMVGSSFCYYYVQELYELGQAAGVDIRVCNLYYSGCPLEKHYNWWVGGSANYQYYETFHDGRKLTSNVSLEWGLAQQEWDVISLQESSSACYTYDDHLGNTKQYWEPLMSYFIEQFPEAQILWHQPWTYQVTDYPRAGCEDMTAAEQESYEQEIEDYAVGLCNYFNADAEETLVQRVNTGRAWQIVRGTDTAYTYENSIGYDYLCGRLGKSNNGVASAGDGYHDGDIGGGQYLNACVWFEVITGRSVVGNTYIPDYATTTTLSDELFAKLNLEKTDSGYALTEDFVLALQKAAHEAVTNTEYGLGLTVTE